LEKKEKKVKKEKIHKCWFCKIDCKIDRLIRVEVGNEHKLMKYAHSECYENYLDKKKFYEYFHEELDVPSADKRTIMIIENISKSYNYKIMLHALKIKKEPIINNIDKGFPYIIAIMKNQLPFSQRILRIEKKERENKPKIIEETNMEEITINIHTKKEEIEKEIEF
jgi:hypothetical protein